MAEDEKDIGPREKAPHERRAPARVPIDSILKGSKEIIIVHNGEDYRLRVTARGKLILTK
ncbi:MAG: hemin uptake protein HemP [Hyphomicrobiaceae bacterium]